MTNSDLNEKKFYYGKELRLEYDAEKD